MTAHFLSNTFAYTFDQQNEAKQKITLYLFTRFLTHLGEFLGSTNIVEGFIYIVLLLLLMFYLLHNM